MKHPAMQVTKEAFDYFKKIGVKKENLDQLEIISDEEMARQKQIKKDFEDERSK